MDSPKLKPPPGACDCHMHVYEDRFALASTATFKPPHAPVSDYRQVQAALGLRRMVVVQPTGYGFDNSCTLKAMAAFGSEARGIVVVRPDTSEAELQRLHALGVRGVRFMMITGGVLPWDALEPMAALIQPLGWHIDLQLDGSDLPRYQDRLARLPCDLVIDHNGKFLEPVAPQHAGFRSLLRLLDSGRCWVKLSAPYETSVVGAPLYDDVSVLARALVQANAGRCLWASNWPHPNILPAPSSAAMLDLLLHWADDDATRRRILVDNPAQLYGYPEVAS
ncbi:MAG: amidohydrolase family protein [Ramlibacter sp.]|nr:amidohydrolase family protein [Ramlibacter sp.]